MTTTKTKTDTFEKVAGKLIDAIQAGTTPATWRKPWQAIATGANAKIVNWDGHCEGATPTPRIGAARQAAGGTPAALIAAF